MFDKYFHTAYKNGNFTAGYTVCERQGIMHPAFLFTTLRIMRVTSGNALWKIGENILQVKTGDIVAVNNVRARQFLEMNNFQSEIFAFTPMIFEGESSCLKLFYNTVADFDPVVNHNIECTDEINIMLDSLKKIFATKETHEEYSQIVISGLIRAIVAYIMSELEKRGFAGQCDNKSNAVSAPEIIAKSVNYINENISKEFGVEELAMHLGLSRGYYTRIFKLYLGTSPGEFITGCRLSNAIRLMSTGKTNILDAAMESGFGSASGFYKTFKNIYGSSPGEFMKKIQ